MSEGKSMAKLKLTVACDKYDYLQPLREGKVQAEGIDLNLITVESGIRHQRMYHYGEYDACEFSMSSYLVAKSQDVGWFNAIPFFPRRMFTHKFCFIRAGSGIKKPADLTGARIGLRTYENTLALITKGMFQHLRPSGDGCYLGRHQQRAGRFSASRFHQDRAARRKMAVGRSFTARKSRRRSGAGSTGSMDSRRGNCGKALSGIRAGRAGLLQEEQNFSDHASHHY